MDYPSGDDNNNNNNKSITLDFIEIIKQRLILTHSKTRISKCSSSKMLLPKKRRQITEDVDKMALLNKITMNYDANDNTRKDSLSQTQYPSQLMMVNSVNNNNPLSETEIQLIEKVQKSYDRLNRYSYHRERMSNERNIIQEITEKNKRNLKITSIIKYENEKEKNKSKFRSKSYNLSSQRSNLNQWMNLNDAWIGQKKKKLEIKKNYIEYDENEDEELSFHPQIDYNSIRIVNKYNCLSKQKSSNNFSKNVYTRLFYNNKSKKQQHINQIAKELTPTFKPRINTNYHIPSVYYSYMNENQKDLYHSRWIS